MLLNLLRKIIHNYYNFICSAIRMIRYNRSEFAQRLPERNAFGHRKVDDVRIGLQEQTLVRCRLADWLPAQRCGGLASWLAGGRKRDQ